MTRTAARAVVLAIYAAGALTVAGAGVKIAGVEFVPKDLIFAAPEAKSRATADGVLPGDCMWQFSSETRVGRREEPQGCIRYYYKTSVSLVATWPAPNEKSVVRAAERITATDPRCPDAAGKIAPPPVEARAISSGTTADGKHQDVILQPDGTRITLTWDGTSVTALAAWPDGTADLLKVP
jgi:hypothetical protein